MSQSQQIPVAVSVTGPPATSQRQTGDPNFHLSSFVALLADTGVKPRQGRQGFVEGVVKSVSPFMVEIDEVTGPPVAAVVINSTPPLNSRVLLFELGAAKRYCLGRIL